MEERTGKIFLAERSYLEEILDWVEEYSSTIIPLKSAMRMRLAVEEAIVNIMDYAYADISAEFPNKNISLFFSVEDNMLCLEIVDNGDRKSVV